MDTGDVSTALYYNDKIGKEKKIDKFLVSILPCIHSDLSNVLDRDIDN